MQPAFDASAYDERYDEIQKWSAMTQNGVHYGAAHWL